MEISDQKRQTYKSLPEDLQKRFETKMTSLDYCNLCETPLEVRNIRAKNFCAKCQRIANFLPRYTNAAKGYLTREEKQRILNAKTTSGKKGNYR